MKKSKLGLPEDKFLKRRFLDDEAKRLVNDFAEDILGHIKAISAVAPTSNMKKAILNNEKLKESQYLLNQMLDPHAAIY